MFESNIVRFFIIPIYVVMALITIYLIGKNSASNDSLKNGSILVASLLPVLIAVLPYLNIREENQSLVFNLIYDSTTKQVITGNHSTPYDYAYIPVFANIPEEYIKADNFSELMGPKGLDLIEKGIINELLLTFSSHWDFETIKQTTPIGESTQRKHSNEKFKKLNLDEVIALFSHNKIINTPGVLVGSGLALPPDSKLLISTTDKERTLTISSQKTETTIQIIPTMGGVIQKGLDGIIEPDPENINRYYIISYNINLNFKPKRFEQYSPGMKKYIRWFNNTNEVLKKMTWEEIAEKNQQRLLDDAIKKILDNKTDSGTSTKNQIENAGEWKQVNISNK